jgi:hypothetical protein
MNLKKMVSLSSVPAILFSLFNIYAVHAYAEESITVMADSVTAAAGENFSVNISISDVPDSGISGIEFAVRYDSSVVTVTSVSEGSIIPYTSGSEEEKAVSSVDSNIDAGNSCVNIMWVSYSGKYIENDGVFVTISGTVNNGASGTAELEIVPVSRNGNNKIYAAVGENAELSVPSTVNGSVTVSSAAQTQSSDNQNILLGDANCDSIIDIRDVTITARSIVKLVTLDEQQKTNADVISDRIIDVKDLGQLKKYIIKLIDSF